MGDFDRLEWARRLHALREATPAGVSDQSIALDVAAEAHAAGYAQATADAVAHVNAARDSIVERGGDELLTGYAVGLFSGIAGQLEQGAHRGAAGKGGW